MFEEKLTLLFREYPESLNDEKLLKGLLKDYFPENNKETNLLLRGFEIGLNREVRKGMLDKMFHKIKLKKKLCNEFGLTEENAGWTVETWYRCYTDSLKSTKAVSRSFEKAFEEVIDGSRSVELNEYRVIRNLAEKNAPEAQYN